MMKQRMYGMSLLVAALAALALTGPARAGTQVPFKGQSSGVITETDFTYPFVTVSMAGAGEATDLGHFTVSGVVVIDVSTPYAQGSWTLTTANGDQLLASFVGSGTDSLHALASYTITGGTGRFQGATGHYAEYLTSSAPAGSSPKADYTDVLVGTISLQAAKQ